MILDSASLFFVIRSLCFIMDNLCSLSSAMLTFLIMVESTASLICFIDVSCFVIFSVRCLRSVTPLRVEQCLLRTVGKDGKQSICSIALTTPQRLVVKKTVECTRVHLFSAVTFLLNEYICSWSSGLFY